MSDQVGQGMGVATEAGNVIITGTSDRGDCRHKQNDVDPTSEATNSDVRAKRMREDQQDSFGAETVGQHHSRDSARSSDYSTAEYGRMEGR